MAATVTAIYRYPVKGLSAEILDRVLLTPGECLPHDRRFAIALGSTPFDPQRPEWLSKTHFIMLMRDEKLARLRTRFDAESGILEIAENDQVLLRARMTEHEGCRLIADKARLWSGLGSVVDSEETQSKKRDRHFTPPQIAAISAI